MSITAEGRGVRSVVTFCALKGCRPIETPGAPCSRCETFQSYPRPHYAALKWNLDKVIEASESDVFLP